MDKMKKKYKILIVDDEDKIRWSIINYFIRDDYDFYEASTGHEALNILRKEYVDLVLLDVILPDKHGYDVLLEMKKISPILQIIIITAYAEIDDVVNMISNGAVDFIQKPISYDMLKIRIVKALESCNIQHVLSDMLVREQGCGNGVFITYDRNMRTLLNYAKMLSANDVNVILVTGETGTGKEELSKYIYNNSIKRKGKPFIAQNCNSFSASLMDSELFGYEQGAFTDAKNKRDGLFMAVNKGVILLDEIGDMHLELQGKLLRVIEQKTIRRIGGTTDENIDIMVILATNKDVEKLVKEGKFRDDLYYRINTFAINVPPLRERRDDIIPLAYFFMEKYNRKFSKTFHKIDDKSTYFLQNYHWPGNVRELNNVIERAVLIGLGNILSLSNVGKIAGDEKSINKEIDKNQQMLFSNIKELDEFYNNNKKEIFQKALAENNGNISKAAVSIGIDRSTFNYNLRTLGILNSTLTTP